MRFLLVLAALALPVSLFTMAVVAFSHASNALGPNPAGPAAPFPTAPPMQWSFVPIPTFDGCAIAADLCAPPTPGGLSEG